MQERKPETSTTVAAMLTIFSCYCLIIIQASSPPSDGQLITAPPKLQAESNRIVWYQIPSSGAPNKFELKCQATGDSIHYGWLKNGQPYAIDGSRVIWQRSGQSGTISFLEPDTTDQGGYQCRASNIFGVALSNIFQVRLGTLDHFSNRPVQEVLAKLGQPLTLPCAAPYGVPRPTIFWLFRNARQSFVIETIDRPHISVDGDGNLRFSHVETHDGRENLIYQCAATSPVLHGEYRAGDEIRLTVVNATLKDRQPEKMWFSPEHVKVAAGDTLKLMCIFSGYPTPQVTWYKKSDDLPVGRLSNENFGKTLIIKPVLHKDQGTYVCRAGDREHFMNVKVSSAPEWVDGPPKNVDVAEDSDIELRCEANGAPSPKVQWFKNGAPLGDNVERISMSNHRKILKIASVQQKIDRAVYQCNASNTLGYVFANAYVNVRAHAPQFATAINQTIKKVIGSSVDLDCDVDAAPLPTRKWTDLDGNQFDIDGEKRQLLDNGTLRIHHLRLYDSDTYFCDVINKFGMNQARRVLDIYKPTYFTLQLETNEKTLAAGDDVELICAAESDERLKIDYIWTKNDRRLLNNNDDGRTLFREQNRLKLTNISGKDSGLYACTAKTEVDEIRTEMKLIVKDVPDAPMITNVQCMETQALIKWTASSDNNDKIKEYFVEYETNFHPGVWKNGLMEKSTDSKNEYEAAVNLSPWVVYSFRVSAANNFGRGLPGYVDHVKCRTSPAIPFENPDNVTVYGTKKDNLIISWQSMDKESWNAPNLTYIVYYRLEHSDEDWHEVQVEDPEQSILEIDGVPTYKKFEVQVKAKNSAGLSNKIPFIAYGFSGEDVPSVAPENFRVVESNATHALFTWDHVHERFLNGPSAGYFLKVWPISQVRKRSVVGLTREIYVPPNQNRAYIDDLKPMRSYAANLVVSNAKYNSTPSEIVRFSTPEGPPGPVETMVVKAYGARAILTTWTPPSFSLGNLTSYRIEYFENDEKGDLRNIFDTTVAVDLNHHLHDSLKVGTKYDISVWAVTGAGDGPKVSRSVSTFEEQGPSRSDFDIQSFDSRSVVIKWLPAKIGLPGTSFHVNYSLHHSSPLNSWATSQTVSLPDRYLTIGNLTPEIDYRFVLYAKDGVFATPSIVKRFRTVNAARLSSRSSNDVGTAGIVWIIALMTSLCIFIIATIAIYVYKSNQGGKYPVKKKELERGHTLDNDEEKSFMEYQYGSVTNTICDSVETSSRGS